jgi:hypothetical protein
MAAAGKPGKPGVALASFSSSAVTEAASDRCPAASSRRTVPRRRSGRSAARVHVSGREHVEQVRPDGAAVHAGGEVAEVPVADLVGHVQDRLGFGAGVGELPGQYVKLGVPAAQSGKRGAIVIEFGLLSRWRLTARRWTRFSCAGRLSGPVSARGDAIATALYGRGIGPQEYAGRIQECRRSWSAGRRRCCGACGPPRRSP